MQKLFQMSHLSVFCWFEIENFESEIGFPVKKSLARIFN